MKESIKLQSLFCSHPAEVQGGTFVMPRLFARRDPWAAFSGQHLHERDSSHGQGRCVAAGVCMSGNLH
jgi:hypothetical protein